VAIEGNREFSELFLHGCTIRRRPVLGIISSCRQRIQIFFSIYCNVPVPKFRPHVHTRPAGLRRVSLRLTARISFRNINSYRVPRRAAQSKSTGADQGIFHVTEGVCRFREKRQRVPKIRFAKMLALALNRRANHAASLLPHRRNRRNVSSRCCSADCFARSSRLHAGKKRWKSIFVREISLQPHYRKHFRNGGDPILPENDSRLMLKLDCTHGCVILAPHLNQSDKKKNIRRPPHGTKRRNASARRMCWKNENELYNNAAL